MAKKLIFLLLWTAAGFGVVVIPMSFLAPLILKWLGPIDEHTSTGVKITYTFLPMVPLGLAAACLLLSIFGKLPDTKRTPSKRSCLRPR